MNPNGVAAEPETELELRPEELIAEHRGMVLEDWILFHGHHRTSQAGVWVSLSRNRLGPEERD